MIRVLLDGRLGNHLFQIATGLAMARARGVALVLDAGLLPGVRKQTDFEALPALQFRFPRCLAPVRAGRWVRRLTGRFPHEWRPGRVLIEASRDYDERCATAAADVTLRGFFQNERYFAPAAPEIAGWFDLSPWLGRAPASAREAARHPNSVGVHVRRTDYLRPEHHVFHVCGAAYYRTAIDRMRRRLGDARFVVVSDDPAWCRRHLAAADIHVCDPPGGSFPMLADLAVFSACRHQIIANSSFSWWGAWLNPNPRRIVSAPDRWMNDHSVPLRSKWMRGFSTVPCDERAGLVADRFP